MLALYRAFSTFLLLLSLVGPVASAEIVPISQEPSTLSVIDSVKNVQSICIGTVIGDPIEVGIFVAELKEQLPKRGFSFSDDKKSCDAIIVGRLLISPLFGYMGGRINSVLYATLLNQNLKTIWKETIEPPGSFPLFEKRTLDRHIEDYYRKRKNYSRNRAIDLACFLDADKKRLNKPK